MEEGEAKTRSGDISIPIVCIIVPCSGNLALISPIHSSPF